MSQVAGWITHRYLKFAVIVFWLVVRRALGPLAGKLTGAQDNDAKSWLPADAESTEVLDVAAGFVSSNTIPAVIVYERPDGLTPEDLAAVAARRRRSSARWTRSTVRSSARSRRRTARPCRSSCRSTSAPTAGTSRPTRSTTCGPPPRTAPTVSTSTSPARPAAPPTRPRRSRASTAPCCTRPSPSSSSSCSSPTAARSSGSCRSSPRASRSPSRRPSIYLLADNYDLTVNAQSAGILTVLVFGAGTDYALLLVARYREELRKHGDRHEAMALALHRASPAIIASGATVAIGMLCLLFATMNSTAGLGPVAAVGVGVARARHADPAAGTAGHVRPVDLLAARPEARRRRAVRARLLGPRRRSDRRRPRATWIGTSALLAVACLGIVALNATGLTTEESFRGAQPSIEGEKVLSAHFPGGAGTPGRRHRERGPGDGGGVGLRRRRGHRPDEHHASPS